jgi:hypothetical protein
MAYVLTERNLPRARGGGEVPLGSFSTLDAAESAGSAVASGRGLTPGGPNGQPPPKEWLRWIHHPGTARYRDGSGQLVTQLIVRIVPPPPAYVDLVEW